MCDAFLVTAQSSKGLSCFFVPRWTPDGRLNEMRIQRFKDKLGDRSNAGTEMAVSYTHLDVYKRQLQQAVDFLPCLLFRLCHAPRCRLTMGRIIAQNDRPGTGCR